MYGSTKDELQATLAEIRDAGLYKDERELSSPQAARVRANGAGGAELLRQQLPRPRRSPAGRRGRAKRRSTSGVSAWRACGSSAAPRPSTRNSRPGSRSSCTPRRRSCSPPASTRTAASSRCCSTTGDAVISDELNHASIIDGIRLCKATRRRYRNRDMADLEAQLRRAAGARRRLIATDGVFSMDGYLAPLDEICDLADATARWCWSTTRTRSGSSGRRARAPPSCSASRIGSTSSPARSARR